jgi:hypothetical protein
MTKVDELLELWLRWHTSPKEFEEKFGHLFRPGVPADLARLRASIEKLRSLGETCGLVSTMWWYETGLEPAEELEARLRVWLRPTPFSLLWLPQLLLRPRRKPRFRDRLKFWR